MIQAIKQYYRHFFPMRQFFIRQNGEVTHVNVASWFQASVVFTLLCLFGWLIYTSIQYVTLNYNLTNKERVLLSSKTNLKTLKLHYLEKDKVQQKKLKTLEQQHLLLQGTLDTLSIQTPPITSPNNTPPPKIAPKKSVLNQLSSLSKKTEMSFLAVDQYTRTRTKKIVGELAKIKVNIKQLDINQETDVGGPSYLFDEDVIPEHQLEIADNALKLSQLEASIRLFPQGLPVKSYYLSGGFGLRTDPVHGRKTLHKGIDLAGLLNTKIFSPAEGVITRAGRYGSYGNFIEIQHANGFSTRYGHLNKIKVKKGQQVHKSDIIALMGSTGKSTGTHLHYEVLYQGKQINPITLNKVLTRVFK